MSGFWVRAELMVKTACAFWPVRARLDLAGKLDKLATDIRQEALADMGQPAQRTDEHGPCVDTVGSSVGGRR